MEYKPSIPESKVHPDWYVQHLQEIADKARLQSTQASNEVNKQVEWEPLAMTPMQIAVYALNCPKEDKYFEEVADLIQRYADTKIWQELELPALQEPTGSRYNYYCAERSHGGPVCLKQCDTCAKMLP